MSSATAESKEFDDDEALDDGFPADFDAKKFKIKGNNGSSKQDGAIDEYEVQHLRTINNKTVEPIFLCIGQLMMNFGANDDNYTGGTGTVFKSLPNNHYLLLTCAHNLIQYDKVSRNREEPHKLYYFPNGSINHKCRLQFVEKRIYDKYDPANDVSPYDLAVVLVHDKKGTNGKGSRYFNAVDINKTVQLIEFKDAVAKLGVYGYPVKSEGLLQGQEGLVSLDKDRGLWIYKSIYTYPGQSGAAIYGIKMEKQHIKYAIYGVHIYGNTSKQNDSNCGIFLDEKKIKWIQKVSLELEGNIKVNPVREAVVRAKEMKEEKESEDKESKEYVWLRDTLGVNDSVINKLLEGGYDTNGALQCIEEETLTKMDIKEGHRKQIMNYVHTLKKQNVHMQDDRRVGLSAPMIELQPIKYEFSGISAVILIEKSDEITKCELEYTEKSYDDDEKTDWITIKNITTECKVKSLKQNTVYLVRCRGRNKDNEWSKVSKILVFTTKITKSIYPGWNVPEAAVIDIESVGTDTVVIGVHLGKRTDEYMLQYKEDENDEKNDWKSIRNENDITKYEMKGLKEGTKHLIRCCARNDYGWSEYSETKSIKTIKNTNFTFKKEEYNTISDNGCTMEHIVMNVRGRFQQYQTTTFGDFMSEQSATKYVFEFRIDSEQQIDIAFGFVKPEFKDKKVMGEFSFFYCSDGRVQYDTKVFGMTAYSKKYPYFKTKGDIMRIVMHLEKKTATCNDVTINLSFPACIAIACKYKCQISVVKQQQI